MKKIIQLCCVCIPQTFTATVSVTLIVVLTHQQQALAQFSDDFSDGDFTHSPTWSGDDSDFIIDAGKLRLQASVAGASYLATSSKVIEDALWEASVELAFNPSSSNYIRIYIASDEKDLSAPLNGYFVMLGGDNDEISFYKQTGSSYVKIIDGRDGTLEAAAVTIKVMVTHDNGTWNLFSDLQGAGDYISEGVADDEPLTQTRYFGVFCNYTSTRTDKFYLDDFNVTGQVSEDDLPPSLEKIEVLSSNQLSLVFSEPIDPSSASTLENYVVDNGVGSPESALMGDRDNTLTLLFGKDFKENIVCELTVSGVKDIYGNTLEPVKLTFTFHAFAQAIFKDVIVTEILADPLPSAGLPAAEFVEIYNRSAKTFSLRDWELSDDGSKTTLPDVVLLPNEYLIFSSAPELYSFLPNAIALSDFPSLKNGFGGLVLRDGNRITIDSVNYSDEWYQDDNKNKGGWTLELIDPHNLCSESQNWVASESASGGTPGEQNSVFANKPDLTGPRLRSVVPESPRLIHLTFDEKLETEAPLARSFKISPGVEVSSSKFLDRALTQVELHLQKDLESGTSYSITASNIRDCSGNLIQSEFSMIEFGMPQGADSLDMLINEILFNPRPTGVDFVELVNRSDKFINLKNWSVARIENGVLLDIALIAENNRMVNPGEYIVLSEDANILKGEYSLGKEDSFLSVDNLPPLNDDAGTLVLVNERGKVVDLFSYTKDMHSIFIKDEEGVSLERISLDENPPPVENWKSASATVGFATPGYLNSNSRETLQAGAEPLTVAPEIFNPIGGQPDFTQIHYTFERGGYVANVKIFDPQGHLIKQLANNDILGIDGFYRWDGDRDDGSKARVGYYMVWFEIFDDQGMTRRYQRPVAIAAGF